LLPALDQEIRAILLESAAKAGIAVKTNVKVTRIGSDKTVESEIGGRTETFSADQVLLATGRPSNVAPLNPDAAKIELDHSAVKSQRISAIGKRAAHLRCWRFGRQTPAVSGCLVRRTHRGAQRDQR
jgi:pyruvate/2-oxoglutarate dehydrogenase complex dihydrolipoamide dehydrogenase (E3) component